jgi:hypothetical protein
MLPWWESRVSRLYMFSLSPHRQRPFAKFWSYEFKNAVRSNIGSWTLFSILAGAGYFVTVWADAKYQSMHRKNPKEYQKYYENSEN